MIIYKENWKNDLERIRVRLINEINLKFKHSNEKNCEEIGLTFFKCRKLLFKLK